MDVAAIVKEADRLQTSNKWREAYDYLRPHAAEAVDPEVLWRLLRSYYRIGKYLARDKQERDQVAEDGLQLYERALKRDENHFNVQKVSVLSEVLSKR